MWKNCSCSWRKNCNCSSKESKFSENLSKVFPKADEFFDNELKNDNISYDELSEITIPNTQSLFKKTKWWKNTWWVKIFLEREWRRKCTEVSCDKNIGSLYESYEHFLDYLSSDFGLTFHQKIRWKFI